MAGWKLVSEVCERYGIAVNMFYRWQEEFFVKAAGVFDSPRPRPARDSKLEKRVADLESRLSRKHEVLSELMEEHVALKKTWGDLKAEWLPHDTRDQVVDFVNRWSEKSEIPVCAFVRMLGGVGASSSVDWKLTGRPWHNSLVPRYFWLDMLVASSQSLTYGVLIAAGLLRNRNVRSSKKGTGCATSKLNTLPH